MPGLEFPNSPEDLKMFVKFFRLFEVSSAQEHETNENKNANDNKNIFLNFKAGHSSIKKFFVRDYKLNFIILT